MSLRLILGRAGTGKTCFCLKELREKLKNGRLDNQLILLVPEQATFQFEQELARTPELGGMMAAQVLSFRRLAWQVFQQAGGVTRTYIGDLGKRMILRKLLENRKAELQVFSRAALQTGFCDSLAGILSEMKRYMFSADQFLAGQELSRKQHNIMLAGKLHDLSVIYQDFEDFLANRYLDPDDYLTLLAEKIPLAQFVQGAEIWLDGFTGFTPQELLVLASLLQNAGRISITLCLDSRRLFSPPDEDECFHLTRETRGKVLGLVEKLGVAVEPPVILDTVVPHRFKDNLAIYHIQEQYFQRVAAADRDSGEDTAAVKVFSAANLRAEVEGTARELVKLSRTRGYRWREMAVILRNLEEYYDLIVTVFADYGIPFFIDQKRRMMHHPLVELIRSALELVAENWSYEPLFRCLKTDLFEGETAQDLSRDEIDKLENYVLAHGIRGKAWTQALPWTFRRRYSLDEESEVFAWEEAELAEINTIREKVTNRLLNYYRLMKDAKTVREMTVNLYQLLSELEVPEKLDHWSRRAQDAGRLEEAKEHAQVWNALTDLFDQMIEALGEEKLTFREYRQIIDSGVESLRLGLIPPGLDQVVVSSLGRSRTPDVKAAFLLGANDGKLPARPIDEGILTDQDREELKTLGLELAPSGSRALLEEQFLVYLALTRSSLFLRVSYPLADAEGRAMMPSMVISRLQQLLPGGEPGHYLHEPRFDAEPGEYITFPERTLSYLVAGLREAKGGLPLHQGWREVYNWFAALPEYRTKVARLLEGVFRTNQERAIAPKIARQLYGQPLRTSVSRLERFQACPFSHFLAHGLGLRERSGFGLRAPDYGQIYHAALKEFAVALNNSKLDWGEVTTDQSRILTSEIIARIAPRLQSEILLSDARHRYLTRKLENVVQQAVEILAEHARRGKFRPVGLELAFGPGEQLPGLKITLSDEVDLELSGRIDRIDAAEAEGLWFLRIIDYKSGISDLRLDDIYHGLSLQLLTYLDICLRNSEQLVGGRAFPAGMMYFRVHNPLLNWKEAPDPVEIRKALLKECKMRGLVLADINVVRLMDSSLQSGWSDLVSVAISREGDFYKNADVFLPHQFLQLRNHLHRSLRQIGGLISSGEVAILPYKKGKRTSCSYCSFKAVCQFEPLFAESGYRLIAEQQAEDVWSKLDGEEGGGDVD